RRECGSRGLRLLHRTAQNSLPNFNVGLTATEPFREQIEAWRAAQTTPTAAPATRRRAREA
ncbi:hypothetical protein, partial [Paraburkholderia mimosarum]|uniref:hypothetical protein n=1 Tax=Paraburkholderia mimosarum TaxID=312026 RepID=UPI001ADF27E6